MHSAKCSAASFALSEIGAGPLPPTESLQIFSADTNAGPLKVIPLIVTVELPGNVSIEKPPPPGPPVGSGKFGTPWDRMHSAIASLEFDEVFVARLDVLEDPHAVIASRLIATASAHAFESRFLAVMRQGSTAYRVTQM
jgi:hypothetical protein